MQDISVTFPPIGRRPTSADLAGPAEPAGVAYHHGFPHSNFRALRGCRLPYAK